MIFAVLLLFAIQFVSLNKTNPPVDENLTLNAPKNVMNILKNSCYDCHSNETEWPYYSNVAPISFFVVSHVNKGRKALNFSKWQEMDSDIKQKRLKRAIKTVNNDMMALPSYISVHEDAQLSKEQKIILTSWFKKHLNE
jgi:hypothetical protein